MVSLPTWSCTLVVCCSLEYCVSIAALEFDGLEGIVPGQPYGWISRERVTDGQHLLRQTRTSEAQKWSAGTGAGCCLLIQHRYGCQYGSPAAAVLGRAILLFQYSLCILTRWRESGRFLLVGHLPTLHMQRVECAENLLCQAANQ